jgi:MraZ protein
VSNGVFISSEPPPPSDLLFLGEFRHALDPKKRLTVPSLWRDQLENEKFLAVALAMGRPCLEVRTKRDFLRRVEQTISNRGSSHLPAAVVASVSGAQSALVEFDSAGRIRVPDGLLKLADLNDQVVMVGAMHKIELWQPARWEEWFKTHRPQVDEMARQIEY